jgi:hypothetical protein
MPAQLGANALSLHCVELLQPPHLPAMHRSGLQSEFLVQDLEQLPGAAPLQPCALPHWSGVMQPQTPPWHKPLVQSAPVTQVGVWHVPPPQLTPEAQSLFALHALTPHLAPLQVPSGHCASAVQVDVLHFAPEHDELDGQPASPAHVAGVLHFAPLHVLPASVQFASIEHALLLHLAPAQA